MVGRGDLVWVNFNPQSGHEQSGHRPALVLSDNRYHEVSNFAVVCPITSNVTPWPWKVLLPEGRPIEGAILVDQIKSIDRNSRKLKTFGRVDQETLEHVLDMLAPLVGLNGYTYSAK